MRYEVYPGSQIGQLAVVERLTQSTSTEPKWRCRCACGRVKFVLEWKLRNGEVLSCGSPKCDLSRAEKDNAGCQKKDCQYWSETGCAFFIAEGHTRTFLHAGEDVDINNPCREYSPGEKALQRMSPFWLAKDLI